MSKVKSIMHLGGATFNFFVLFGEKENKLCLALPFNRKIAFADNWHLLNTSICFFTGDCREQQKVQSLSLYI